MKGAQYLIPLNSRWETPEKKKKERKKYLNKDKKALQIRPGDLGTW